VKKHRLITLAACVATAAVAGGTGVATADYPPSPSTPENPPEQTPGQTPGQGQQGDGLTQSRRAQVAYLEGSAEVGRNGRNNAGDASARGVASLFAVNARTVCYGFSINGTDTPTNVHVHRAPAGRNGPVVIDFTKGVPKDAAGKPSGNPGSSSGCKVLTSAKEIAALSRIRRNPAGYYVNVHTKRFEDGALRGQLHAVRYDNTR
jgi:hypothetical protein